MEKMYFLDLDGTMYRGNQIQEGGKALLSYLQKHNQPYLFLTNNSSRTGKQNVEHMERMGYTGIKPEDFFTSAMAASIYVRNHFCERKAFYIGEDGLKEALLNQGFSIVEDEQPDFVFVGLDKHATYLRYSKAIDYLINGAKLIGTNHDRILAQANGYHVGNGAIVTMFEYASSQESPKIGKPHAPILEAALAYCGKNKNEIIIVGDNLETDIALGVAHGVESIMVLGGVHTVNDIDRLQIQPDRVIERLSDLIVEE